MRYSQSLAALLCSAALVACNGRDSITGPESAPPLTQVDPTLSLTGEDFFGSVQVSGSCEDGALAFDASGVASGPYPGLFGESGQFGLFGNSFFIANFTIDSPIAQITGRKESTGSFLGFCENSAVFASGTVEYQANWNGFHDHGLAFVLLIADQTVPELGFFNEFFTSLAQAVVVLEPATDVNPVGTSHTVTATVFGALTGQPQPGVTVRFTVSSPLGFTANGSCTTGADGRCTFTYQGPNEPDVHTIEGCAEIEPSTCGIATKIFVLPAAEGQITGGGQIIHNGMIRGVSFGFNAQVRDGKFHGSGAVVDHRTKTRIKILDVDDIIIVGGTHAEIRGNAEVNGVRTRYIIDVDDLATPGMMRDTFKIVTESGYAAAGPLSGGNIDIK